MSMTITAAPHQAYPRIVVHSFETANGAARPVKHNQLELSTLTTRRSHKKSRNGCLRCKTRRIKCDEQRPLCSGCKHGAFPCVYRNAIHSPTVERKPTFDNNIRTFPSMTSDTFTLEDMRFFHHFLIKAKPHLPVGNAAVWAREIPQLTQQNGFLMHSFLALGSSHLGRLVDNQSFQVQSLTYRVKGLAGLREAMTKESWANGDADSMIAAGYSLMQQSAHIEDGMGDWMSLLRMVISISFRVAESGARTEFDLSPGKHQEYTAPYQHLMPSIDQQLLPSALTALENLHADLTDPIAIPFHAVLEHCLREHQASPIQGYIAYGGCFKLWLDQSEQSFAEYIDPRNGEVQLLMAYFILILLMMMAQGIVENHEVVQWSNPRHIFGMLGWIRNALLNVPLRLREHTKFVEGALAAAVSEINGEALPGPRVLQFDVAQEFLGKINIIRLGNQARMQSVSCDSAFERGSGSRIRSYRV